MPAMASASFAGVLAPAFFTEPSKEFSNSLRTATSLRPGWTNTVPCSAAGMFHSRPWKTSVSSIRSRASTMSGLTFSTPILACASLPWSVMTIQSRPCAFACRTWSTTRYLASELYWVWMWWSPASHRYPWDRSLREACDPDVAAAWPAPVRTLPAARPAPSSPVRRNMERRES